MDVHVLIRTAAQLRKIVASDPYKREDPTKVVVAFLEHAADAKPAKELHLPDFEPEGLTIRGTEIYLDLPGGQARSKLLDALGKKKVFANKTTSRNWRTVVALRDMTNLLGAARTHRAGRCRVALNSLQIRPNLAVLQRVGGSGQPRRGTSGHSKVHSVVTMWVPSGSMMARRTGPGATASKEKRPRRSLVASRTTSSLDSSCTVNAPGGMSWPTIRRDASSTTITSISIAERGT